MTAKQHAIAALSTFTTELQNANNEGATIGRLVRVSGGERFGSFTL